MAAGRPRKPNHVKEAQGTLEKSRINDRPLTYMPLSAVPDIPDKLDVNGAKYYKYVCQLLISKRLLTPAFLFDIERAALWYSVQKLAERDLKEYGLYQMANSGFRVNGPWISNLKDASKFLGEFENKYGLNLVSGQKIEMPEIQDEPEY